MYKTEYKTEYDAIFNDEMFGIIQQCGVFFGASFGTIFGLRQAAAIYNNNNAVAVAVATAIMIVGTSVVATAVINNSAKKLPAGAHRTVITGVCEAQKSFAMGFIGGVVGATFTQHLYASGKTNVDVNAVVGTFIGLIASVAVIKIGTALGTQLVACATNTAPVANVISSSLSNPVPAEPVIQLNTQQP